MPGSSVGVYQRHLAQGICEVGEFLLFVCSLEGYLIRSKSIFYVWLWIRGTGCTFVSFITYVFMSVVPTVPLWCRHSSVFYVNDRQQLGASSLMMCEASAFLPVTEEVG